MSNRSLKCNAAVCLSHTFIDLVGNFPFCRHVVFDAQLRRPVVFQLLFWKRRRGTYALERLYYRIIKEVTFINVKSIPPISIFNKFLFS